MTNRLLVIGPRLALLVAAAALAACSSSDSASVVSSADNSTTAATTIVTAVPTTVAVTEAPTTTSEPTTTTVAPTTAAPTTTTTEAPTTTSGAPAPGPNVYLAYTDTGNVTARSGDQVLGEASCGECSVSAATYRDGTIWMAAFSDVAEVTRHDLATGATVSVYRADPGVTIDDVAVWDSSVWIVTSTDEGGYDLIAVDAGGVRPIEAGVLGVQASQDGRFLAYATCGVCAGSGPRNLSGSVIVVADLISGAKREIPAGGDESSRYFIAPVPTGWTSDGQLLVDETWEGYSASLVDAFNAATQADAVGLTTQPSAPGQPSASAEAACFVDAEHVAVARWSHPYAEGEPEPGVIVVRTLTSADETPYGAATVIGGSMACDTAGAVVVATDDGRLVRISPDGTTTELGIGYAMVSAV